METDKDVKSYYIIDFLETLLSSNEHINTRYGKLRLYYTYGMNSNKIFETNQCGSFNIKGYFNIKRFI